MVEYTIEIHTPGKTSLRKYMGMKSLSSVRAIAARDYLTGKNEIRVYSIRGGSDLTYKGRVFKNPRGTLLWESTKYGRRGYETSTYEMKPDGEIKIIRRS